MSKVAFKVLAGVCLLAGCQSYDSVPEPDFVSTSELPWITIGDENYVPPTVDKIYRSGDFGDELFGSGRCNIDANYCEAAATKYIKYKINSNCSTWWQNHINTQMDWANFNLAGSGWTVTHVGSSQNLDIECGAVPGDAGALGGSQGQSPIAWYVLDEQLNWGMPAKWRIILNTTKMASTAAWISGTDTQRKNGTAMLIRHEFGHTVGLGHNGVSGTTMVANVQTTNVNAWPWTAPVKGYRSEEYSWLDCYNPNPADSTSDCQ